MQLADIGGDIEQIWLDSKDGVEKYQKSVYDKQTITNDVGKVPYNISQTEEDKTDRIQQDESDQNNNSPILNS